MTTPALMDPNFRNANDSKGSGSLHRWWEISSLFGWESTRLDQVKNVFNFPQSSGRGIVIPHNARFIGLQNGKDLKDVNASPCVVNALQTNRFINMNEKDGPLFAPLERNPFTKHSASVWPMSELA